MTETSRQDPSALKWVRSELTAVLKVAQRALEEYVEGDGDKRLIASTTKGIKQVHGILVMLELHGAALLSEEMSEVASALAEGEVRDEEAAAEALMLALIQLPEYLDRLEHGALDVPLGVLSMLNDMRAVRDAPLLSEHAVFIPEFEAKLKAAPAGEVVAGTAREVTRRLRPRLLKGVLNFLRSPGADKGLDVVAEVLASIHDAAETPLGRRTLRVFQALVAGVREGSIESSIAVKQLVGQIDRQLKRLLDVGEEAFQADPPADLLKNQLYYIAQAVSDDPLIQEVREDFALDHAYLNEADASRVSATPGSELYGAVQEALNADLLHIKDVLDLFIRGGSRSYAQLEALAGPLHKVADTLGMLGQGRLRSRLIQQADELAAMAAAKDVDESRLMDVASDILFVEASVSRLIDEQSEPPVPDDSEGRPHLSLSDGEFNGLLNATLSEAIVEMARVKEAISGFLVNAERYEDVAATPGLLHRVAGAHRVLDMNDAAELFDEAARLVDEALLDPSTQAAPREVELLADAITSLDYFMEAVSEGRRDDTRILDMAREALTTLQDRLSNRPPRESTARLVQAHPEGKEAALDEGAPVQGEAGGAPNAGPDIDQEILDIFVEEAREEIAVIDECFPKWREEPSDEESLIRFRRSFHTLKGSGRLVGASDIGELAWSVENLLNRVIEKTIEPDERIFSLVDEVRRYLPVVVDAQEQGHKADGDKLMGLMARAFELAEAPSSEEQENRAEGPVSTVSTVGETEVSEASTGLEASSGLRDSVEETTGFTSPGKEEPVAPEEASGPALEAASSPVLLDTVPSDFGAATDETAGLQEESLLLSGLDGDESVLLEEPRDDSGISGLRTGDENGSDTSVDTQLLAIFASESAEHLTSLREYLERIDGQQPPYLVDESIQRVFHTLHGSAKMADVEPIAEISGAFERYLRDLTDQQVQGNERFREVLAEGIDKMQAIVDFIETPDTPLPEWEPVLQHVDELHEALRSSRQVLSVSEEMASSELPSEPMAEAAEDELDPELVEIFLEEARELQDGFDAALRQWGENPSDPEPLALLQRNLHTLKGGARLAGIDAIGDLSHALETLLSAYTETGNPPGREEFELAQQTLDTIASQVDQVALGQPVAPAETLLVRLETAGAEEMDSVMIEDSALDSSSHIDSGLLMETSDISDSDILPESEMSSGLDDSDATQLSSMLLKTDSELLVDSSETSLLDSMRQTPKLRLVGSEEKAAREQAERERRARRSESRRRARKEYLRIRSEQLDKLVDNAGEVSIYRARLEQQNANLRFNLGELDQTVARLRRQLRDLEIETETQILFRYEGVREVIPEGRGGADFREEFDPLELDRFSNIQELSRALAETVDDLVNIQTTMTDAIRETDTLLLQQSRVSANLQDGLLRTRMVPFSQIVARLQRLVRQTAQASGKRAELDVTGAAGELDRGILERITPALEHLLRNAVSHGVEPPDDRERAGKPPTGRIHIDVSREGTEVLLNVSDDGAGLDVEAIRRKAVERGLLDEQAECSDDDALRFVLEPGFSTADKLTQIAGRGVGMDVVVSEVKALGGTLDIDSEPGRGARFLIRLPFTLAVSDALMVQVGDEIYAVPHSSVEGVVRVSQEQLQSVYAGGDDRISYAGKDYNIRYMADLMGVQTRPLADNRKWYPTLLVKAGDRRVALQVDRVIGNQQVVVKPVGPQVSSVRWITGGTILGDGQVALIIDLIMLVRMAQTQAPEPRPVVEETDIEPLVMVVDDSVTVRKVTERLLTRNGLRVVTAKDGVEALSLLQDVIPDVMLLDIEMPRMDGFELARHMRNDPGFKDIPIIMITSRTGEKHRDRALQLGVRRYLGKPYQEAELLENIQQSLESVEA